METTDLNLQANDARLRPRLTKKCPRCNSMDTKFCYYNNYSLNQPRHYCKTCRRYWTHGGICRNIPIGGSSYRRNIRANVTRTRATLNPNAVRRRRRRSDHSGSITESDGRCDGRIMPSLDANHHAEFGHTMSSFGSMSVESFNNNNVVNVSNGVAPVFGTFQQPLQPPSLMNDVDAWNCMSGAPPLLPYDIDVIIDQWFKDLHGHIPSPPPPPSA